MIDISNEIYTDLSKALALYDTNIETAGVYQNAPSHYPFVSFEEIDNSIYENGMDCCEIENFVNVDYEINIYTQNKDKKSKGDKIANVVDTLLKSKGLVRITRNILQDTNETTYRIVMRYSGVVSKDHIVYRR